MVIIIISNNSSITENSYNNANQYSQEALPFILDRN